MKINVGNYVVKVNFWGDNITPMYKFKVYKTKRWLIFTFNELVGIADYHRKELVNDRVADTCNKAIEYVESSIRRWEK